MSKFDLPPSLSPLCINDNDGENNLDREIKSNLCGKSVKDVERDGENVIDGISFVDYKDESQLYDIMRLVEKDLSEPYSIFTYRYFLHQWPDLCIMAIASNGEPIGCVICKIDEELEEHEVVENIETTAAVAEEDAVRRKMDNEEQGRLTNATNCVCDVISESDSFSNVDQSNKDGKIVGEGQKEMQSLSNPSSTSSRAEVGQPEIKRNLGESYISLPVANGESSPKNELQENFVNEVQHVRPHLNSIKPIREKILVKSGYMAMLAVDKSKRRTGIGSALVHRAVNRMRTSGCSSVVLETEVSNVAAMRLYERLGFIREELLIKYYLNWGDAYRLRLWFDDGET